MQTVRSFLAVAALLLLLPGAAFANVPSSSLMFSEHLGPFRAQPRVEAVDAFPVRLKLDVNLRRSLIRGAIDTGQDMIGTRYEYGADREDAVDCSALVRRMFGSVGVAVPRTTRELVTMGRAVKTADLRPGDLLFYRFGKRGLHVAVFVEGDRVLHASVSQRKVVETTLGPEWQGRRVAVRRMF